MIGGVALISVHSSLASIPRELSLIPFTRFPPLCYVMSLWWLVDVNVIWMQSFCLFLGLAQSLSHCGACPLTSSKNSFILVFYNFIHVYEVSWSYLPFVNLFFTPTPSKLHFLPNKSSPEFMSFLFLMVPWVKLEIVTRTGLSVKLFTKTRVNYQKKKDYPFPCIYLSKPELYHCIFHPFLCKLHYFYSRIKVHNDSILYSLVLKL